MNFNILLERKRRNEKIVFAFVAVLTIFILVATGCQSARRQLPLLMVVNCRKSLS
jgi:hypothetical protein